MEADQIKQQIIDAQKQIGFDILEEPFKSFYEFHGVQLAGSWFPPSVNLLKQLYKKLHQKIYDAGDFFQIIENQSSSCFEVLTKQPIQKDSEIFLIDHAFTFRYADLRLSLEKDEQLTNRLKNILKYSGQKSDHPTLGPEPTPQNPQDWLIEIEDQEIEDPNALNISNTVESLSLWGNNISDINHIHNLLKNLPNLKALWLNGNPISQNKDELFGIIEQNYPNIEILNSKFTKNIKQWGLKYVTFSANYHNIVNTQDNQIEYLNLSNRNVLSLQDFSVFKNFPNLQKIILKNQTVESFEDINKLFSLLKVAQSVEDIEVDPNLREILEELIKNKKLQDVTQKLNKINGLYPSYRPFLPNQEDIEFVFNNIWKLSNSYRLASTEQLDETSIWYVMDEFGSAICHSDKPNVTVIPFLFAPNNKLDDETISYSILWPVQDLDVNTKIFRDYLFGLHETRQRSSRLNVWFNLNQNIAIEAYNKFNQEKQYFTKEGHKIIDEVLKIKEQELQSQQKLKTIDPRPIKVYSDYDKVVEFLNDENFQIVEEPDKANILWIKENFDDFVNLNEVFINQFPYEACIVLKHNLAYTAQRGLGYIPWLQVTYDLDTELKEFIGDYQRRKNNKEDNLWIIKPHNMARSLDMIVTDNMDLIIRAVETGPKLAQKYITNPLTIRKKKIDMRFVVVVRSIVPLEIFIYKVFWIRTSNNEFNLDPRSFTNYETHFTVMNYGKKLEQIHYYEFIDIFEKENAHKNIKWNTIYDKIKKMVQELFICVRKLYPQMQKDNSRSIYGMDVMVDQDTLEPKLLEMTFAPDCDRACKYHPEFFNDIFRCLFLNKNDNCNMDRIL